MTLEEVIEALGEECREDHVGLWELISAVRNDLRLKHADDIRSTTLQIARKLLDDPDIQVGFPTPDGRGFVPWKLRAQQAIQRIDEEWSLLGREPDIGDVAWFTSCQEATSTKR